MKRNVVTLVLVLTVAAMVTILFQPVLSQKKNEKENSLLIANHIYDQLLTMLSRPLLISQGMAADRLLHRVLQAEAGQSQEEMEKLMADYLGGITDTFGYLSAFVISEKSHRYYTPKGITKIVDPASEPYDIWYQLFLQSGKQIDLDTDRDQANDYRWAVFLNARITGEDGELLGVCGVGVFMDRLQELISHEEKAHGYKINFIEKDGLVQVDTDSGNIENASITEAVADKAGSEAFTYTSRHSGGWRMTRYVPELEWFLVIQHLVREKTSLYLPLLLAIYGALATLFLLSILRQKQEYSLARISGNLPTDRLTGLPNRNYVRDNFGEQGIFNTTRYKSLVMFDIDRFKVINETRDGDGIIQGIVSLALNCIDEKGMLFRWSGDEFVCFLELEPEEAEPVFKNLCGQIKMQLDVTVSVGIVEVDLTETIKTNYHRAVQLCYAVKEQGGNGVQVAL